MATRTTSSRRLAPRRGDIATDEVENKFLAPSVTDITMLRQRLRASTELSEAYGKRVAWLEQDRQRLLEGATSQDAKITSLSLELQSVQSHFVEKESVLMREALESKQRLRGIEDRLAETARLLCGGGGGPEQDNLATILNACRTSRETGSRGEAALASCSAQLVRLELRDAELTAREASMGGDSARRREWLDTIERGEFDATKAAKAAAWAVATRRATEAEVSQAKAEATTTMVERRLKLLCLEEDALTKAVESYRLREGDAKEAAIEAARSADAALAAVDVAKAEISALEERRGAACAAEAAAIRDADDADRRRAASLEAAKNAAIRERNAEEQSTLADRKLLALHSAVHEAKESVERYLARFAKLESAATASVASNNAAQILANQAVERRKSAEAAVDELKVRENEVAQRLDRALGAEESASECFARTSQRLGMIERHRRLARCTDAAGDAWLSTTLSVDNARRAASQCAAEASAAEMRDVYAAKEKAREAAFEARRRAAIEAEKRAELAEQRASIEVERATQLAVNATKSAEAAEEARQLVDTERVEIIELARKAEETQAKAKVAEDALRNTELQAAEVERAATLTLQTAERRAAEVERRMEYAEADAANARDELERAREARVEADKSRRRAANLEIQLEDLKREAETSATRAQRLEEELKMRSVESAQRLDELEKREEATAIEEAKAKEAMEEAQRIAAKATESAKVAEAAQADVLQMKTALAVREALVDKRLEAASRIEAEHKDREAEFKRDEEKIANAGRELAQKVLAAEEEARDVEQRSIRLTEQAKSALAETANANEATERSMRERDEAVSVLRATREKHDALLESVEAHESRKRTVIADIAKATDEAKAAIAARDAASYEAHQATRHATEAKLDAERKTASAEKLCRDRIEDLDARYKLEESARSLERDERALDASTALEVALVARAASVESATQSANEKLANIEHESARLKDLAESARQELDELEDERTRRLRELDDEAERVAAAAAMSVSDAEEKLRDVAKQTALLETERQNVDRDRIAALAAKRKAADSVAAAERRGIEEARRAADAESREKLAAAEAAGRIADAERRAVDAEATASHRVAEAMRTAEAERQARLASEGEAKRHILEATNAKREAEDLRKRTEAALTQSREVILSERRVAISVRVSSEAAASAARARAAAAEATMRAETDRAALAVAEASAAKGAAERDRDERRRAEEEIASAKASATASIAAAAADAKERVTVAERRVADALAKADALERLTENSKSALESASADSRLSMERERHAMLVGMNAVRADLAAQRADIDEKRNELASRQADVALKAQEAYQAIQDAKLVTLREKKKRLRSERKVNEDAKRTEVFVLSDLSRQEARTSASLQAATQTPAPKKRDVQMVDSSVGDDTPISCLLASTNAIDRAVETDSPLLAEMLATPQPNAGAKQQPSALATPGAATPSRRIETTISSLFLDDENEDDRQERRIASAEKLARAAALALFLE